MKKIPTLLLAATLCLSSQTTMAVEVTNGVSHELAVSRTSVVSDIAYDLTFDIPALKTMPVKGKSTITFVYKEGKDDLQLDFQGSPSQFDGQATINGKPTTLTWHNEHIIIPRKALRRGKNTITLSFISGDKSLNRNADYMYTLFVPDHARSVFPCFDQPDLKALFSVKLNVPEGWESMASVATERIPTYLFSFVAGKYHKQTAVRNGRTLTTLYRETDPKKVAQLDTVFDIADHSIRWFEEYTGIKYPFSSFGFVVLPGYQFGGMEHPGAIQFTDHEIFLGDHPTPEELQTRVELIAHETAHCWFGDDVTMRWFNDVWTKEVFANFLASKIAKQLYPDVNHDLNFLRMYQTRALNTDRTPGTHPIQQPLDNLNSAGLLYGNIIYQKSPVMMRKLEEQMGAERFRNGLQEYLHKYAYANATWDELINILDRHAPEAHLKEFSEAWVKQKGMPTITTEWNDGQLVVKQTDPYNRGLKWQQSFTVDAVYINKVKNACTEDYQLSTTTIPVNLQDETKTIALARRPDFIIPNADGSGYGLFLINCYNPPHPPTDDLKRFALAMNLNENYLAHGIGAKTLATTMQSWLAAEKNALIASQLVTYWGGAITNMNDDERHEQERQMWQEYRSQKAPSVKQRLIRQLYYTVTDKATTDSLYNVWAAQTDPLLSKTDYTQIAYRLAILKPQQWQEILQAQRARITNEDELRQFDFISRACTPDKAAQQQLFQSLLKAENRRIEPWTSAMLRLLNDRSREPFNNAYLRPGLDALIDVQRTGDIFFPGYWLSSLLAGHHSQEARQIVETFINEHPDYPEKLMNKIKENAYTLLR